MNQKFVPSTSPENYKSVLQTFKPLNANFRSASVP